MRPPSAFSLLQPQALLEKTSHPLMSSYIPPVLGVLNLPTEVFMKWVLLALTLLFQNRNMFWTLKMLRVPPAGVCSRGSGGWAASLAGSPGAQPPWG